MSLTDKCVERLATRVTALVLLLISPQASAYSVPMITQPDAETALFAAMAIDRVVPECAAARARRSTQQDRGCAIALDRRRADFEVTLEACNEGGRLENLNVTVPQSYGCVVTVRQQPDQPAIGGVVIFYQANHEWYALIP